MFVKIDSEVSVYAAVERCTRAVLLSSNKKEIAAAFARLECILDSSCVCTFCDGTKGIDFVFEFGRCLVPSRTMQLIKERHLETPRWAYVGPLYKKLYDFLYEDLSAHEKQLRVVSNGELEDVVCHFKLLKSVHADALEKIQTEKEKVLRRKFRAANPVLPGN